MQIIDGFQLNAAMPIDSRLVTSGTASRNAIVWKYNGLRVYDTDAKQPFVWNGSIWTSENSSTVTITGTTTTGYIPVFNGTSQVSNSLISQVSVGPAMYVNIATGNYASYALKVNGKVNAQSFEGSGNGLTNIPGESILGNIDVNKLKPYVAPDNGIYILKSGVSTPEWISLSSIPAGALPAAAPSNDTQSGVGTPLFVSFTTTSGQSKYYQTTGGDSFKFVPRVGSTEGAQLLVPNGSEANPSVAFSTNANTGIYRAGWNILGISVAGKEKMRLTENGVLVKTSAITEASLKVLNSGGRPFLALYGLNGDSQMSGTIGFSGLWNGSAPLNDLIIENFAGTAAKSYPQIDAHFDANVPVATDGRRHMINMNVYGQTIVATNVGSVINRFTNGVPSTDPNPTFPYGAYGCDIYNSNPSLGHGLIVKSGGGPNTVSARFDNGNKTIAYFTDRGLQIMSGTVDAPSICFDSDKSRGVNTGFYLEQGNTIGLVAGNKKILTFSDREIRLSKVSNLAYIFGDNTRLEGTTRTNSIEIYRPTTNPGFAICHFYSDIGGIKAAKAYIWPDGSYYRLSDRRQKENIKPLEYGLDEVLRLNPVTHTWLYSQPTRPSIGLIAQEVEEIVGEVVNTMMDGDREVKALDYSGLIPILIKSIQELSKKIEILESK